MSLILTISAATINPVPLDLQGNARLIGKCLDQAAAEGADLVLLPELCLTGYGCEDMFYAQDFIRAVPEALKGIMERMPDNLIASVGLPVLINGQIYNSCALFDSRKVYGIVCKQHLARTGIHYENRWFTPWKAGVFTTLHDFFPGEEIPAGDLIYDLAGVRVGYEICEDSWVAHRPGIDLYARGIDLILNPSASHFALGKHDTRRSIIAEGSRSFCCAYIYANLLGNEAGRAIYDGDSMIASCGKIVMSAPRLSFRTWEVHTAGVDIEANRNTRLLSSENICQDDERIIMVSRKSSFKGKYAHDPVAPEQENEHLSACRAVALGLWDFMRKTRTGGFALSLSGGADSALCAATVCYAFTQAAVTTGVEEFAETLRSCGINLAQYPHNPSTAQLIEFVKKEVMPRVLITLYQGSDHSGEITRHAAKSLAEDLGASHYEWSISTVVAEYEKLVNSILPSDDKLSWEKDDITLQNIQARSRSPGIWMIANRFNKLLIATSNLSEASVGYCTMDGDTSGVISPIAGISKSRILEINRYIGEHGLELQHGDSTFCSLSITSMKYIIAQRPTAELRPVEQTDEQDLMPYPLMDEIRRLSQVMNYSPQRILEQLVHGNFGEIYSLDYLRNGVKKYFRLYCRNQWKRERIAVGFHIEADSADPKTFRRFPVLSSMLNRELQELDNIR